MLEHSNDSAHPAPGASREIGVLAASNPAPRIDSRHLLAGGRELVIDHDGQQYRLRLTRNHKLILTK